MTKFIPQFLTNTKTACYGSSCDVDLTGFAPASLRVKGNMLLHTPQAQVHASNPKIKRTLSQGSFLLTRNFGLWCLGHVTYSESIANYKYMSRALSTVIK